jgi:hypothetical protein
MSREDEHFDIEPDNNENNFDVFKELNKYKEYCRELMKSPATDQTSMVKASDVTKTLGQIKKITNEISPEAVTITNNISSEIKQEYFEELISQLEEWIEVFEEITGFRISESDINVQNTVSDTWLDDFFSNVTNVFDKAKSQAPNILRKSHEIRDEFLAHWLVAFKILSKDSIIKRIRYLFKKDIDELYEQVMKFEEKIKETENRSRTFDIVRQNFKANKKLHPITYLENYILEDTTKMCKILEESEKLVDSVINVILLSTKKNEKQFSITTSLQPLVKKIYAILENNKHEITDFFERPILLTVQSLEQRLICLQGAVNKATSGLSFNANFDDNVATMKLNDFKVAISTVKLAAQRLSDNVNFSIQVGKAGSAVSALRPSLDFNQEMMSTFWNFWLKNDFEKLWNGITSFNV